MEIMVQVERLLQHFRADLTTAARAFFLWKGINNYAASDRGIYRGLNEQALSWNILTNSLQTTFFIVLYRLFDTDGDAFSAHTFLRGCIENIEQFSKDALKERKLAASREAREWLDEFIKSAYVPEEMDFQRMRGELSKQQKQYEEIYRPIRHKVVAHKDVATMDNAESLFEKTKVEHIEEFISFLYQIQEVVHHLLYNGRLTLIGDHRFNEEEYVVQDVRALLDRLRV